MTPRSRRTVAVVCIALVLFAAFVPPVASSVGVAILVPLELVLPAITIVVLRRRAFRCDEQSVALLSFLDPRGPPVA